MADPKAMGFVLPAGDDYIREGDNAISINAQAAADLLAEQNSKWDRLAQANRTALHPLSMPGNNDLVDVEPSRHVRLPVKFFVTVDSWELVLKNFNDRTSRRRGRLNFVNVYIGERATDGYGDYTANYAEGTRVNLGVPSLLGAGTDAERYSIPGITFQLKANVEYIIGYAFTHTNEASHMGIGGSYLGTQPEGVPSYNVTNTWSPNTPLDVYIKPQISTETPFYVYPGSSSETGQGSAYPLRDVWAWRHAEAHGAVPALIGQSGSMLSTWIGTTHYVRSKFSTIARADKVIGNPGSNDLYGGVGLPEMKTLFASFAVFVRRYLGDAFEAIDVFPRASETAAVRTVRSDFNAWLYSLPENILQCHVRAEAVSTTAGLMDARYNSGDNVHVNTAGQHMLAAAILSGRPRPDTPTHRYTIDQTAGRVVKVWDYLNNREQLIYGDTGWRDVTTLVGTQYVSGVVRIKRDAQTVTLHLDLLKVSGTGFIDLPIIPSGFQNPRWFRHQMALGETVRVALGNLRLEAAAPADTYDGMISWPATQPWPTTLPGTADGSITA